LSKIVETRAVLRFTGDLRQQTHTPERTQPNVPALFHAQLHGHCSSSISRENNMADDKSKAGRQDRDRINVNEDYELRDWSKKLGVSPEELKKAVQQVGTSADAVKKHLGKKSA
jgi:Protein of unknown function (DUF3606)